MDEAKNSKVEEFKAWWREFTKAMELQQQQDMEREVRRLRREIYNNSPEGKRAAARRQLEQLLDSRNAGQLPPRLKAMLGIDW
jgi:F0F1-type ATP synthase membrane subunit b/b'